MCIEPALARPAVAARDLEGHYHPIAGTRLSDVATDIEHNADRLMAQHGTRPQEGAHGLVQVEIGSADVGTGDLDDRVVGSLMTGSATSSTEMSRKPCQVTAFISRYALRQSSLVRCQPA